MVASIARVFVFLASVLPLPAALGHQGDSRAPELRARARLVSVGFEGIGHRGVELDGYGLPTEAHWVAAGGGGGLADANPFLSPATPEIYDRQGAPIAYVRGSKPALCVRIAFDAETAERADGMRVTARVAAAFDVGGEQPRSYEATADGALAAGEGEKLECRLALDRPLPDSIGWTPAFEVFWSLAAPGREPVELGTSRVPLYLLREAPAESLPLLHTPVHLACVHAAGLENDAEIVAAVWAPFAALRVERARDGQPLEYYGRYHQTAGDLRGLLVSGGGQCTTWAYLLHAALGAHGIASEITGIFPAAARGRIFVADWVFLDGQVFVSSGKNGICETKASGDDVQAIAMGRGRPHTRAVEAAVPSVPQGALAGDDLERGRFILTGPDGIVQSALPPELFVPVVPRGFGIPQQRGYRVVDRDADIALGGDDRFGGDANDGRWVLSGPNGILETDPQQGLESAAMGRVKIAKGRGSSGLNLHAFLPRRTLATEPRDVSGDDAAHDGFWIGTGPDGICDTAARDGEEQVIAVGRGMPDVPVIGLGPDGRLSSEPGGDDEILDLRDSFELAGEDYPYIRGVNMWPLLGVAGQQAESPPPDYPNHVILRVGDALYDPSYGTGRFASHAEWEAASLDATGTQLRDAEGTFLGKLVARRDGVLSRPIRMLPPN